MSWVPPHGEWSVARLAVTSRPSGIHCWLDVGPGVPQGEAEKWLRSWLEHFDMEETVGAVRYAVFFVGCKGDMEWPHEPTAEERLEGAAVGPGAAPDPEDWDVVSYAYAWHGVPEDWPPSDLGALIEAAEDYLA